MLLYAINLKIIVFNEEKSQALLISVRIEICILDS